MNTGIRLFDMACPFWGRYKGRCSKGSGSRGASIGLTGYAGVPASCYGGSELVVRMQFGSSDAVWWRDLEAGVARTLSASHISARREAQTRTTACSYRRDSCTLCAPHTAASYLPMIP